MSSMTFASGEGSGNGTGVSIGAGALSSLRLSPPVEFVDATPMPPLTPSSLSQRCLDVSLELILPFLTLKDAVSLSTATKKLMKSTKNHIRLPTLVLSKSTVGSPSSLHVLGLIGTRVTSLSLYRITFSPTTALSDCLRLMPNLRRLSIQEANWPTFDADLCAEAVTQLKQLQELRLHCGDHDKNPFGPTVARIGSFTQLRKVALLCRLDAAALDALRLFVLECRPEGASRKLQKVKFSTGLMASPGMQEVLRALAQHPFLQKLTVVRPDGHGELLRRSQCEGLSDMLSRSRSLTAIHLRRCGMWADALASLVPSEMCPSVVRVKLDGNSLGYLSNGAFNEAMHALLSKLPNLTALHLGNNQIDTKQGEGLARSIAQLGMHRLETLTLGSNDIGDEGLTQLLRALPKSMKQIYLHGIDCTDKGMEALEAALKKWPDLWGLGLNGNPVTDKGAFILARMMTGRTSLRDIGITLSEMTDAGCDVLGDALATCTNLRYVYLYTAGFKSATHVSEEAKARLKAKLPAYCTAAFDHRLSRYLKKP